MKVCEYPTFTEVSGPCRLTPKDSISFSLREGHHDGTPVLVEIESDLGCVYLSRADAIKLALTILNKLAALPEEVSA